MFDIVIGNPPYQEQSNSRYHSSKQSGSIKLWGKFLLQALNITKQYLAFITPLNWMYSTNKLKKVILPKLIYANIDSEEINKKYFPAISSTFSYYILQPSLDSNIKPIIRTYNEVLDSDILYNPLLPAKNINNTNLRIFNKLIKHKHTININWIRKDYGKLSEYKTKTYKYPTLTPQGLKYSDKKDPLSHKYKIAICRSREQILCIDEDISTSGYYYTAYFESKDEMQKIYSYLTHPLYIFIVKNIRSGMAIVSSIKSMPFPKTTIQPRELYKFFGLSAQEIKHIEETIK